MFRAVFLKSALNFVNRELSKPDYWLSFPFRVRVGQNLGIVTLNKYSNSAVGTSCSLKS